MSENAHDVSGIRRIQMRTLAVSEIRRSIFSAKALPLYLLVGMPIALMLLRAVFMPDSMRANPAHATTEFAEVFNFFLLRFVVFFSNALIFVRLFRGEILERSLHYHLLAPVRREVLAAASGLVRTDPSVAAIVLECTNLPPYAAELRLHLGLPVFDSCTLVEWLWRGTGIARHEGNAAALAPRGTNEESGDGKGVSG